MDGAVGIGELSRFPVNLEDAYVAGVFIGYNKDASGGIDFDGLRYHVSGGFISERGQFSGVGIKGELGDAVVSAIGDVEEPTVWRNAEPCICILPCKIGRQRGKGLECL